VERVITEFEDTDLRTMARIAASPCLQMLILKRQYELARKIIDSLDNGLIDFTDTDLKKMHGVGIPCFRIEDVFIGEGLNRKVIGFKVLYQ
jgi:hypothetical protein